MSTKQPTAAESAQWHREQARTQRRREINARFDNDATAHRDSAAHHEAAAEALDATAALRAEVEALRRERDAAVSRAAALEAAAVYWLRRAFDALGREGWEEGPTEHEVRSELRDLLESAGHNLKHHPPPKPDRFPDLYGTSALDAHDAARDAELRTRFEALPVRHATLGDGLYGAWLAQSDVLARIRAKGG